MTNNAEHLFMNSFAIGFPSGSDGKETACNVGDLGLIPGLGRSPEEGNGYPLQYPWGFLGGSVVKESTCQCKRCRRHRFDPWIRKIPWRRKWQSIPLFLPGKHLGQRCLAGSSPWDCKRVGYYLVNKQQQQVSSLIVSVKTFCSLFKWVICFLFLKKIYIVLKYSWLTMFQVHSKVIQIYKYTLLFLKLFYVIDYYKILTIVPCAV